MTFYFPLLGFEGVILKNSPFTENSDGATGHPSLPVPSGEKKKILASCLNQQLLFSYIFKM